MSVVTWNIHGWILLSFHLKCGLFNGVRFWTHTLPYFYQGFSLSVLIMQIYKPQFPFVLAHLK